MRRFLFKRSHHRSLLRKHHRLLLWLLLSLYLFLSSTSPSSLLFLRPPSLRKPTLFLTASRSLAVAVADDQASSPPSPPKVFVYDLPPRFNADWLANPRCGSHLFAAEVALHRALLSSPRFLARDPAEADFFLVPVYVSCNFSTANGFPSLAHARPLLAAAVRLVSSRFPFWNRTAGRDHLFVASHDYGACFHAMEDLAAAHGIPPFLRHSVLLQTFGVLGPHRCQEADHVLIPPYVPPEVLAAPPPEKARRDIFVFFRGKMEVHPKNISGRFYSRRVRTEIWNRYATNRRFYLRRKRYAGYQSEIARSVFCLCPLGWAPWSPRLVESVALGCVPVVIADGIRLPFGDAVDWPGISLTVAERDVGRLEAVLDGVAASNLTAIQRNLWDPAVRRALVFGRGVEEGDATWQVMRALEGKLDRSWRRRRRPAGRYTRDE